MGYASQVALGAALFGGSRPVVCLDGDGAILMHMGGLATIGSKAPTNLIHILLNNGAHDSVGGQPTCAFDVSLYKVAEACGYKVIAPPVSNTNDLLAAFAQLNYSRGPWFLETLIRPGARTEVGRPKQSPVENKQNVMEAMRHIPHR
ncbi:hypothetical protein HFO06_26595 [Rhizobium leguminosarum]|nr:hypothetical protein [Rhizobium leguminosarum]